MKKLLFLLTCFLITWAVKAQKGPVYYPDYDIVISRFFETYSIKNIPGSSLVRFEKRPTGWHVAVSDYSEDQKIIKDELFWSRKKNRFEKIDFEKLQNEEENQEHMEEYQNAWGKRFYKICPYYGYPGWDWDVIQDFKDAENRADTFLYALGRAYSSYASNLLNNNSGLADKRHLYDLPEGKNSMTSEQLEKYRYYRHKGIEIFRQLTELNPKFETIVGPIGIKTSNEYLTSFLDLRMYQNEQEAKREIMDDLYNDFYISVAKNYLSTCKPNAILFTNGDNDTYPLLYVQSKYGFRTDVLVVNMSLLQTPRYINSLREPVLNAPGLPVTFTAEEIQGGKRDLILIENYQDFPMDLPDLINFVKDEKNVKLYGGKNYYYVPANKFRLTIDENIVEWQVDMNYFFLNQLILLDILNASKWERPIYFTISMENEYYFGLTGYIQLEGLACQLTSSGNDVSGLQTGIVNTSVMYDNLMNKFDWNGIKTDALQGKIFCIHYRNIFHRLADAFISENKIDSAKMVLDKCIDIFPDEIVYFDVSVIPLIEDYYRIEEFEKGNQIALQLANNLKNNIDNYIGIENLNRIDIRDVLLYRVKSLAEEYGQHQLVKELEELPETE